MSLFTLKGILSSKFEEVIHSKQPQSREKYIEQDYSAAVNLTFVYGTTILQELPKSTEFMIIINGIMHCILYIVDCKTGTLPTSYLLERSLEHGINSLPWKTAQASEFSDGRIKNKWITLNKMFLFVQNKHLFGFLWISETEK